MSSFPMQLGNHGSDVTKEEREACAISAWEVAKQVVVILLTSGKRKRINKN